MSFKTAIGSLQSYEKGSIELHDDLRHYAFSNIYEVANSSEPFERVQVVMNIEYAVEVTKVDGSSPWYTAPHDEFATVMDGEVSFLFYQLTAAEQPHHQAGAIRLDDNPKGKKMGNVTARLGHQVLLPAGAAYQLSSNRPSVVIIQTLAGPETVEKWSQICTLS